MMTNKFLFISIAVLIVLSLGMALNSSTFFSEKINTKNRNAPINSLPKSPPSTMSIPTISPAATLNPTITMTPAIDSYQTLSFLRPNTWSLWGSPSQTFSFAYDASKYNNPEGNDISVSLVNKKGISKGVISMRFESYDGGSRHKLLLNQTNYKTKANSLEKNYYINGKSSLFIYNTASLENCTVGSIVVNKSQVLIFTTNICNSSEIEPILSTFKF